MFELPKHIAVHITKISNDNKKNTVFIFDNRQFKSNQRKNLKIEKERAPIQSNF